MVEPTLAAPNDVSAAAAEAMRRILVENARRKARKKHGGDLTRQELQDVPAADLAIKEIPLIDPVSSCSSFECLDSSWR
jgi:ECF sigma factor